MHHNYRKHNFVINDQFYPSNLLLYVTNEERVKKEALNKYNSESKMEERNINYITSAAVQREIQAGSQTPGVTVG